MTQPTSDFEAYNLYLLGRHHFHKRTELALTRAVEYFLEARTRDPQFALAYSGYADAMSLMSTGYYGNVPVAESIAKALPAAQRALAIAPDLAEAHASMGLIRHNQRDLEGAIASLQHAIRLRPAYTLAHVWLGVVLNSIGRYREAAETNTQALRLDPLSPIINTNAGIDATRFGKDLEAEARFRHAIELDPAFPVPYSSMARLKGMRGALDEALMWATQAAERAPTRAFYLARKGFMYLQLNQLERAEEWLTAARNAAADSRFAGDAELAFAIASDNRQRMEQISANTGSQDASRAALAAWMLGDEMRALSLYDEKCPDHDLLIFELINDDWVWRFPHALYRAHLRIRHGNNEAVREAASFIETLDRITAEGIVNPNAEYWAVVALAMLGKKDEALQRLDAANAAGWRNLWWARRDPSLKDLTSNPRFDAMLARVGKQIDACVERL
jgi:tetratricopeptide (TPR) repeat protein